MIVKNQAQLATTELRRQALDIIEVGINRVLPTNIMKSALSYDIVGKLLMINNTSYNLSKGRLFVIGGGKASGLMAEALESIIPPQFISAGVVNCKSKEYKTSRITVVPAGHPIPDQSGIEGVKKMLALKDKHNINENDLVICLISGGGSALMPYPADDIGLEDKQRTTELLLGSGAEIAEINAVRKHLSQIKGGKLGYFYLPATVVSLILSDVIGNDLSVIASGPTFPDATTFPDAFNVLETYHLLDKVPRGVISYLKAGCQGKVPETPKILSNCHNYIIGGNRLALEAMLSRAQEMGFTPCLITAEQKGDTTSVAWSRANEIMSSRYSDYDAFIIGGETIPKLPITAGKGGRNQHYTATSMLAMKGYSDQWLVASIGTDGSDFLPDVAGAIVDNNSLSQTKARGVNIKSYLDMYNSNTLLNKIGNSLIITGDTGTNVGDVILYLLKGQGTR